MPKLEAKQIQKQLDSGLVWPVYWLYGTEKMKSRELVKRIRAAVLGPGAHDPVGGTSGFGFNEDRLDGGEQTSEEVLQAALTLSFGGGARVVIVRDAHLLKDGEALEPLMGPAVSVAHLPSTVVFLSKDLDGRKKFSKVLLEKAAVVSCDVVPEDEREAWIHYLAKRRSLQLDGRAVASLRALDPWSLDIIDQECEKLELYQMGMTSTDRLHESLTEVVSVGGADLFFEAFFSKDLARAISNVPEFADHPELALPLLGLMTWNVRQLALSVFDQGHGTRSAKLSPFLADRFNRWSKVWRPFEVERLQHRLAELDWSLKQTPRLPLGLWAGVVQEFCS